MAQLILSKTTGADEIFQEFEQLNDKCMDKSETDIFVFCEVPPLKYELEIFSKKQAK